MQTRALLVSLFLVLPSSLLAQDPPFRAGQWAAQFAGGASFVSIGAIKFKSPTRALVLDLRVSGFHREGFTADTLDGINSQASISLLIGRRWYRPAADKVVVQHSLGIQGGFQHFVSIDPFLGKASQNGWGGGPFAELGAVYLITPHFGIGATGTASITYTNSTGESFGGLKTHSWSLGGNTAIFFSAALFF